MPASQTAQADRIAYSLDEAAEVLATSRRTINRLIVMPVEEGGLRSFSIGSRKKISADALREFVRAREAGE